MTALIYIAGSALQGSRADGGIGIAIVGMATVFIGLVVLSVMLPLLKKWAEGGFGKKGAGEDGEEDLKAANKLGPREVAAITAAIHAHFCLLDQIENMKLTWEAYEKPYTPWRLAGKAELIQESGSLQNRIRRR